MNSGKIAIYVLIATSISLVACGRKGFPKYTEGAEEKTTRIYPAPNPNTAPAAPEQKLTEEEKEAEGFMLSD